MTDACGLLAYLVSEGCLPLAAGQQPSAPPPQNARVLSPEARAAAGHQGPGVSVAYPAEDGEVVADYGLTAARLRIEAADAARALSALEGTLINGLRDAHLFGEGAADDGRLRRSYYLRLSEQRYAQVDILYPAAGVGPVDVAVFGKEAVGRTTAA
jgi:hypothetical protein